MRQASMSMPREVLPGRFHLITRRCTQRQFLLRPDPETNNAFIYCLGEAAARFEIDVVLPCAMSNHHHTVIFDRHGRVIEFVEHLHKMLAKSQNALRGRWENFWSSEPVCIVHLVDRADVVDKIVYAATNPVKDRLVERVHHWPGVNGLSALLGQRPLHARRPRHFFRRKGPMPADVTLQLTIPPELGEPQEVLRALHERAAAVEAEEAAARARTGRTVLGRRRVLRQAWYESPTSPEQRRGLRPRVAARSKWARLEALRRNRDFVTAYRVARTAWLAGAPIPFPPGTYWLRRFAGVPIAA
jgi:REP element-mobilizing transposase RayT